LMRRADKKRGDQRKTRSQSQFGIQDGVQK